MIVENFLRPRLLGARFDEGAIPLEFLSDLSSLSELLVETAKWKFRQANPSRKRSPRGFGKSIEFKLQALEQGSAVPVISLVIASSTLFAPENQQYVEQAREEVIRAIDSAAKRQPIRLPDHLLAHFDRLGRNLGEGEAIEFPPVGQQRSVRLDKETRRTLLLASSTVTEVSDAASVRGLIPEVDQDDKSFEIRLIDGRKLRGPLTAQHREDVLRAFNDYSKGQRVLIDGIARFNRQNRLIDFESVEQVTLLDPLDIASRIDELRVLPPGWLEGHGTAPTALGLDWLADAFEANYPDDVPVPHLYPTPEGQVRAEWSLSPYEVSLEIDLAAHSGAWHALNLADDSETAEILQLTDANGWKRLFDRIRALPGGTL